MHDCPVVKLVQGRTGRNPGPAKLAYRLFPAASMSVSGVPGIFGSR